VGIGVAVNSEDERSGEPVLEHEPASAADVRSTVEGASPRRGRSPAFNIALVVVVGVLITAGLSIGAAALHNSNEDRLLNQRAREVGAVISAAVPSVQTPLASAQILAESTGANRAAFRRFVTPLVTPVKPSNTPQFTSVSLWRVTPSSFRPLIVVGDKPELALEHPRDIRSLLERAGKKGNLAINNLLAGKDRRLGFAYRAPSPQAQYVVYAEAPRPRQRRANVDTNVAFSELDYAFYIGDTPDPQYLLASSTGGALLHGRHASTTVPFGDSTLLIVTAPRTELGGTLLAHLWWLLGLLGLALTMGAATLVGRITSRRQEAERLATENAHLYAEQRSVAQTLQHSLLAEAFPEIGGLEFGARYVAGVEGIDIGGDWYDVVQLDHGNILIVVGDVSGRGLEAATMMASLRYSARAYAVEGYSPATILTKLSGLASVARDGHFATVLCGALDVATGRVTIANAGHPAPLLVGPNGAEFVETNIGVPVGVRRGSPYTETEFVFTRGSTLLLYTDGAVERRGERLDAGLQRLRDVSSGVDGSLEQFLDTIVSGVLPQGAEDDTALLGVRWRA
jgi:serine phosphatase RsbU (regulator of sigma subunit)